MDAGFVLGCIGLIGAAVCIVAYGWGYVIKAQGFRPLAVLSLFSTVVAMAQLALLLTGAGGHVNAVYAMAFLIVSGLAQAYSALKARRTRTGMRTRKSDKALDETDLGEMDLGGLKIGEGRD
jgi:hypothetical protein